MNKFKLLLSSALLLTSLSYAESVQNNNTGSFTCKDNEFLTKGKMFTDVCWSCIFPIKISELILDLAVICLMMPQRAYSAPVLTD